MYGYINENQQSLKDKGIGLGLYTCKKLMNYLKGNIEIHSK